MHLRDIIQVNNRLSIEQDNYGHQLHYRTHKNLRNLLEEDQQEDNLMDESKCAQCLERNATFCTDLESFTKGVCCDDATAVAQGLCDGDNPDMTCSYNLQHNELLPFSNESPFLFKKSLCPNNLKCQDSIPKVIRFSSYYKITNTFDSPSYINNNEEHCSYWIKPPTRLNENDFFSLKVQNFEEGQITVYIVREGVDGDIEFIEEREFQPQSNKTYWFLLQKLQYVEDKEMDALTTEDLLEHHASEGSIDEVQLESYALVEGYSTQYSIIMSIEGRPRDEVVAHEIEMAFEEGFEKPLREEILESQEQIDQLYTMKYAPVWTRITNLKEEAERDQLNEEFYQGTTPDNVDDECQYYSQEYVPEKSLFRSQNYHEWFTNYFSKKCGGETSCTIDPSWIQNCRGYDCDIDENPHQDDDYTDANFDYEDYDQELNILPKISDRCLKRIRYLNHTSPHFLAVVGCKDDTVNFPLAREDFHKEFAGVIIVSFDIVSILIMAVFFYKLQAINMEYLNIMDNMTVQMKDFTIKINDLELDKYTQDSRALKMKLWLHFTEVLKRRRTLDNKLEVLDVTLSIYTQKNIQVVFRMQKIQTEVNTIQANLSARVYKDDQVESKLRLLKEYEEKLKKLKDQYKQIVNKRDKTKANTKRIPKYQRLRQVQYVFVVFKDCTSVDVVETMFQQEIWLVRSYQAIFNRNKPEVRNKQFLERDIQIAPALEPDEIIWDNLAYSKKQQRFRSYVIRLFAIAFTIGMILLTVYIGVLEQYLQERIPNGWCPEYWVQKDPENQVYKDQAYADYYRPLDQQENLMGCYCGRHSSIAEPWTLINIKFQDPETGKEQMVCLEIAGWQVAQELVAVILAAVGPLLNEMIAATFLSLGKILKKHTKVEEYATQFLYIFILEFINLGLISLMTSQVIFEPITTALLGWTGQVKEQYPGFTPAWYMDTGRAICFFIFMSPFLSNSADLKNMIRTFALRLWDRNFSMELKKDPDDEGDDAPNTKKKTQSQLEGLYTGDEFNGEKAYSRMMSILFCILLYSGGMPILYFIGIVLYTFTYLAHKLLILKFYQKSRTLTRTIPIFSMNFFKMGIVLHMLGAVLMLAQKEAFETKRGLSDAMISFNPVEEISEVEKDVIGDDGKIIESSLGQFDLFHQQMYLVFIIAFGIFYLVGKSLYGLLVFVVSAIARRIKNAYQFLKKQVYKLRTRVWEEEDGGHGVECVCSASTGSSNSLLDSDDSHECESDSSESEDERDGSKVAPLGDALPDGDPNLPSRVVDEEYKFIDKINKEEARMQKYQTQMKIEYQREERIKRVMQKRRNRPDYSENMIKEITCENLSSFYQRSKKELDDFLDFFNLEKDERITPDLLEVDGSHPKAIVFTEICFLSRITSDEAYKYQKFLIKRIRDIEEVIDSHFKLIIDTIIKRQKDGFEKERKKMKEAGIGVPIHIQVKVLQEEENYLRDQKRYLGDESYPQEQKLKYLIEHQDDLLRCDRERKENRTGMNEILRMTGSLTQSYFIFDSQQYKVGRRIYYSMDDDNVELQVPGSESLALKQDEEDEENTEGLSPVEEAPDEEDEDFRSVTSKRSSRSKRSTRRSRPASVDKERDALPLNRSLDDHNSSPLTHKSR